MGRAFEEEINLAEEIGDDNEKSFAKNLYDKVRKRADKVLQPSTQQYIEG